nr:21 kDa protein-like [Tanacetum cinerariifolium]
MKMFKLLFVVMLVVMMAVTTVDAPANHLPAQAPARGWCLSKRMIGRSTNDRLMNTLSMPSGEPVDQSECITSDLRRVFYPLSDRVLHTSIQGTISKTPATYVLIRSDHQLAKAAITVSFKNTKSAFLFVSKMARVSGIKPSEHQAVKDCISTMTNSVTSLSQSVQELEKMARTSGQDFEWHMSNVETWDMEERVIELEALQKALLEGIQAYDKLQANIVKARDNLNKIFTSKDVKATVSSARRSNQTEAADYMEKVRGAVRKYYTV